MHSGLISELQQLLISLGKLMIFFLKLMNFEEVPHGIFLSSNQDIYVREFFQMQEDHWLSTCKSKVLKDLLKVLLAWPGLADRRTSCQCDMTGPFHQTPLLPSLISYAETFQLMPQTLSLTVSILVAKRSLGS